MIIGKANKISEFKEFIDGINRAGKGVVHIQMVGRKAGGGSICTGWFITDTLIAVPFFALDQKQEDVQYTCKFSDSGETDTPFDIKLEGVHNINGQQANMSTALMRLQEPHSDRVLMLEINLPDKEANVFIPQYPGGTKNLMISAGFLLTVDDDVLRYNADTLPGSSGAPIVDIRGRVVGVHWSSSGAASATKTQPGIPVRFNTGTTIPALIRQLKGMPQWEEIARHHRIISLNAEELIDELLPPETSSTTLNHPVLVNAALEWYMDPESLTEHEKELLKPHVIDIPGKWVVREENRQRIISSAGSLTSLRNIRKKETKLGKIKENTGSKVVGQILKGPPYHLNDIKENELPYWLQAVTWFSTSSFKLPTAEQISLELERRRIKSRLKIVAGPDFAGRITELAFIKDWYDKKKQGPLLITGIGGIGKSALISKFILDLPDDTVYFWLDFDRVDLSPDDAESVLNIIVEQAFTQIQGFKKIKWNTEDWKSSAKELGKSISSLLKKNSSSPLLVLDGFEVAQHAKKYNEIWTVLEQLMEGLKELKVIVSGRAHVKSLSLLGRKTVELPLKGMDDSSAAKWLKDHGITEKSVVEEVIRISRGIPLILRLAARLIEKKGDVFELPKTLPVSMIQGYLYQRILDRVVDPRLESLAKEILVLRKLTIPILKGIFASSLPANMQASEVFERLMREMSLVTEADQGNTLMISNDSNVLHLRPEVRSATLRLLTLENSSLVKQIHQKAIDWYEAIKPAEPANTAEIIYHYLHLGEVDRADMLWDPACLPFLTDSEQDFEENSIAYKWLTKHNSSKDAKITEIVSEEEMVKRIREAFSRKQDRIVPNILMESEARDPGGILIMYDTLMKIKEKDFAGANELLSRSKPQKRIVKEQKVILQALAKRNAGNRNDAEMLLRGFEETNQAEDQQPWSILQLLARAARIDLNVRPEKELALYQGLKTWSPEDAAYLLRLLSPADVILPALIRSIQEYSLSIKFESLESELKVPVSDFQLAGFFQSLNERRKSSTSLPYDDVPNFINLEDAELQWEPIIRERLNTINLSPAVQEKSTEIIMELAIAGFKKWMLATNGLFLYQASQFLLSEQSTTNAVKLAVTGSLASLHGVPVNFMEYEKSWNDNEVTDHFIDHVVRRNMLFSTPLICTKDRLLLSADIMIAEEELKMADLIKSLLGRAEKMNEFPLEMFIGVRPAIFSVLLLLLGPDPLEVLCRQLLGLPDDFQFKNE